jgi:hypothetical protein
MRALAGHGRGSAGQGDRGSLAGQCLPEMDERSDLHAAQRAPIRSRTSVPRARAAFFLARGWDSTNVHHPIDHSPRACYRLGKTFALIRPLREPNSSCCERPPSGRRPFGGAVDVTVRACCGDTELRALGDSDGVEIRRIISGPERGRAVCWSARSSLWIST